MYGNTHTCGLNVAATVKVTPPLTCKRCHAAQEKSLCLPMPGVACLCSGRLSHAVPQGPNSIGSRKTFQKVTIESWRKIISGIFHYDFLKGFLLRIFVSLLNWIPESEWLICPWNSTLPWSKAITLVGKWGIKPKERSNMTRRLLFTPPFWQLDLLIALINRKW